MGMQALDHFPCTRCGECCRHVSDVPQLSYLDRGDGVCVNLQGDLCGIYDERPEYCRVDEMYAKYFYRMYSKEEFYRLNLDVCRFLQEAFCHDKDE